jgi:hypothetical protein
MALRTAVLVGAVGGLVVPWLMAQQDPPILGGVLDGMEVPVAIGSHYFVLHWSWLVFSFVSALVWLLLNAAGPKS